MSAFKTPVTVDVLDRASALEILDGGFRVVARGFGRIRTDLAPGLYKARTQVGGAVQEKLFAVEEGTPPPQVRLDPVAFPSPAPLQDTSTTHEYHQHPVAMAASNVELPLSLGSGSSLLLSIRDASNAPFEQTEQTRDTYARSFSGFSLCAVDGSELINYDQAAHRNIAQGLAIRNAQLDPGNYILRFQRDGFDPLALPVVTVPGWASQIFVFIEPHPLTEGIWHPVLHDAAVMMVPLGHPFEPGDRNFRLTEVARQALQRGRNVLDRPMMDDLLGGKFDNPVLGLLAAHLLLLEQQPPLELLQVVVGNLEGLLGFDFPDVIALRGRMQQLDPSSDASGPALEPMVFPPLLRASWELAATMAMKDDRIFPPDSVSRQVADRVLDNGIWMAWRPRPAKVKPSRGVIWLSDDELQGKKLRDRDRIIAVIDQAERAFELDGGRGLLRAARTLAKPVMREKLRQFIKSVGQTENQRVDQARDLLMRLAQHYPWEKLVKKLSQLDADGEISGRLSSVQKSLIPALMMLRQQMEAGQQVETQRWEQLIESVPLPRSVLLDNLGDLARLATGLVMGLQEEEKE